MSNYSFLCFLVGIVASQAIEIKRWENCGGGEILKIEVEPCSSEPCVIKTGVDATVKVTAISDHTLNKPLLHVTALVGNIQQKFPGMLNTVCDVLKVKCPIEEGAENTYVIKLHVSDQFNSVETLATFKVSEGDNNAFCFKTDVKVEKS